MGHKESNQTKQKLQILAKRNTVCSSYYQWVVKSEGLKWGTELDPDQTLIWVYMVR